jgi:hypothetical protein
MEDRVKELEQKINVICMKIALLVKPLNRQLKALEKELQKLRDNCKHKFGERTYNTSTLEDWHYKHECKKCGYVEIRCWNSISEID